jgi:hypothetical protein
VSQANGAGLSVTQQTDIWRRWKAVQLLQEIERIGPGAFVKSPFVVASRWHCSGSQSALAPNAHTG